MENHQHNYEWSTLSEGGNEEDWKSTNLMHTNYYEEDEDTDRTGNAEPE